VHDIVHDIVCVHSVSYALCVSITMCECVRVFVCVCACMYAHIRGFVCLCVGGRCVGSGCFLLRRVRTSRIGFADGVAVLCRSGTGIWCRRRRQNFVSVCPMPRSSPRWERIVTLLVKRLIL